MKHFLITLKCKNDQHIVEIGNELSTLGYQTAVNNVSLPFGVFYIERSNKETGLSIRREILARCQSLPSEQERVSLMVAMIDGFVTVGDYTKTELEMSSI